MEALLRVRLDVETNKIDFPFELFKITQLDVENTIETSWKYTTIPFEKKTNFTASVYLVSPTFLKTVELPKNILNPITDNNEKIILIDIELGSNIEKIPKTAPKIMLDKYAIILATARKLIKSSALIGQIEIVKVTDNYLNEKYNIITPTIDTFGIGTKYRLYLDDVMISERFYPYDMFDNEILEENVFVDILPGTHTLRVESFGKNTVKITHFGIIDQITRDINAESCSFEFR